MRTHKPKKMRINNVGINMSISMNTTTMHTSTAHATTITAPQQGKRPKRKNLLPAAAVASKTPTRQKTATKATGTLIMTTTTATIIITVTHTALAATTTAPPCKSSTARKHLLLGNGFASWRWIAP